MKSFFEELFDYNQQCNQQLINSLDREPSAAGTRSLALFSHMLNAHHIWNTRIRGQKNTYRVWDVHAVGEFAAIDKKNHEETRQILATHDLSGSIAYTTSTGEPFTNTVHDTLFHVINHSTYHRGQLALLFRENGIAPLITDYIFYKR